MTRGKTWRTWLLLAVAWWTGLAPAWALVPAPSRGYARTENARLGFFCLAAQTRAPHACASNGYALGKRGYGYENGVGPNCCGEQFDQDLGLYYNRARYLNQNSGRFWSMDSYEGSKQDAESLHKYLDAKANPNSYFDPSGNFSIGFGNDAHTAIQDQYELEHVGDSVLTGTTKGIFYGIIAKVIKPDIGNFTQLSFAEIKPFSIYGIYTGIIQLAKYKAFLTPFGFQADLWPVTPRSAVVQGKLISYFNAGGLIFYTDPSQNAVEMAALVALAASRNISITLGVVRSSLVYVRAAVPAYSAAARSIDIAEVDALPAEAGLAYLTSRF